MTTPKALGPYLLEQRIATGGMAEVFVAKRLGPHGFAKRVALKRILPQFARDSDFVAMFIDEARLAAQLEHPNVVQVFDFGEHGGELFLAMELVDGSNVNRLLRMTSIRNEPIPLDVALHLVSQTARALAYAHALRDQDGNSLGLVHRDVSPANLLVTRSGHVKLGDFGIARAAFMAQRTDEGRLRGKLGYMSPEQVLGRPLDGRSDVFTLTTILAELVIGEPLFGAGADLDVLVRIRDADLRTLEVTKRRIPRDVRRVIERGLSRDRVDRPTAAALAEMVDDVIRRRGSTNHGAGVTERLIGRLDLAPMTGRDLAAREPGARPTRAIPELEDVQTSETERLVRNLATTSPAIYRVKLPSGETLGPFAYARLVELITRGVVGGRATVAKEDGDWAPAASFVELTRFATSPALQWLPEDTARATQTGVIAPSIVLGLAHRVALGRETGAVHLDDGERRKKIYFVDGRPEFVASTVRDELLGEYLVQTGTCLRMEVEMALAMLPRYSGRLGDALVGLGVLRPVELYRAVAAQVRARYLDALRWQHGAWHFVPGAQSHEEAYPFAQEPLELLRDAVFETPDAELGALLAPYAGCVLEREQKPASPVASFRLPESWERALAAVRARTTLADQIAFAVADGIATEPEAQRAYYLGISCGLVRAA